MSDSSFATADRVVVGTDGSPAAQHAVDWAARVAAKRGRTLLVLVAGKVEQSVLDAEVQRVRQAWEDLIVESISTVEDPAEALVQASRDAALVVVGARGHSAPLRSRALGGVSDHVVTHAQGQTMVVPEDAGDRDGPVVVGVDDSPEAIEAIRAAFGAAERSGSPLRAIHAMPEQLAAPRAWASAGFDRDALLAPSQEMVHDILAPFVAEFPEVSLTTEVVWGHPAKVLADASRDAHIVVVGSHGHGGFAGLLLGSTCRELLRHSEAPVMVLRRGLSAP